MTPRSESAIAVDLADMSIEPFPPAPPWSGALRVVGVTGTNGKTSTAAFLAHALRSPGRPVVRVTTVGTWMDDDRLDATADYEGLLDGLQRCLQAGGRFAVLEITSEALALGFARAWPCAVGVFTNLSHDHLDAHGSFEHYLASKAQLFVHLPPDGAAILNGCDSASALVHQVVPSHARSYSYGVPSRGQAWTQLDLQATCVRVCWDGTEAELSWADRLGPGPGHLRIRAVGEIFVENALAAIAAAVATGVEPEAAVRATQQAAPPEGRFELVRQRPYVVVDYAHTPDALARTLATARQLCAARLHVVFGAGGERDLGKRAPMGQAACAADEIWLTSDNPRGEDPLAIIREIHRGVERGRGVTLEPDRETAIRCAIAAAGPDDVVIVAGRGPETRQEIAGMLRPLSDAEVARSAARDG